jgi:quinol monooxygenase YgiN
MAGVLLHTWGAGQVTTHHGHISRAGHNFFSDKERMMIYAIARMTIPSGRLDEALAILNSVTQRSRFQHGCIRSGVYKDMEYENEIMLEQVWENEKDLEHHLRSDDYQKVLLVAEMALARPDIRFDTVVRTAGFEKIEKARTTGQKATVLE